MERKKIKKILRENLLKEEKNEDVVEQVKEEYPTLYEFRTRGGFKKFFMEQANKLGLTKDLNAKRIHADADRVKEATKTIKNAIKTNTELTPEQEEELEEAEITIKWYKDERSHDEAKEENLKRMTEEFGIVGDFYLNKNEWFDKYPILRNDKLSRTKGESTSFTVNKMLNMFAQGHNEGLRHLTRAQIEWLHKAKNILKDIIEGETPEEYEYLGKGSNRELHDTDPMPKLERYKEMLNNIDDNIAKSISRIITKYKKNNKNVNNEFNMPEVHKNDFDKFYEHIRGLAYKIGIDLFADLTDEINQEMVMDTFEAWWKAYK